MEEQNDLEYRLARTKKTARKYKLDKQEKALLLDQIHTMRKYNKILSQRILYALRDDEEKENDSRID